MRDFFLIGLVLLVGGISNAQSDTVKIDFSPRFGNQKLELGKSYYQSIQKDSIQITTFRFYISHLEFLKEGKVIGKYAQEFILMDMEKPETFVLQYIYGAIQPDQVRFQIGIDSATNVSGAMGDDLDPTNGMYWAWQSGYINVKLEGKSIACPARNHVFQYHLGGYLKPYLAVKEVTTELNTKGKNELGFDLSLFFDSVNVRELYEVMRPCEQAVKLAEFLTVQNALK